MLVSMRCFIILWSLVTLSYAQDFGHFQCSKTFTQKQFSIQSPNYPESYPDNLNCEYVFKGEGCPTYYNLQFLDFGLEYSLGCTKDRLEIGQNVVFCGSQGGIKNYLAENGDLTLKLISDHYWSGSGFNILVTRQPCLSKTNETKLSLQSPTENCCNDIYDQKRFTITNPGFPHSTSTSFDCVYKIQRANDQICRLRLIFKFYWNGIQNTEGCSNGYIEIDNKKICGCRPGLRLTANFDDTWKEKLKVIKYKNNGFSDGINGFAIEIFQDECLNKHETYGRKSIHKRSYYFQQPRYFDFFGNQKDIEESIYVDISNYNPSVRNSDDRCRLFGHMDWFLRTEPSFFENIPKCRIKRNAKRCIILDSVRGQFRNRGYPYCYLRNLNHCYRFVQQPGYCSVKLHMQDFDLQYSHHCLKDYVSFENGHRYCGNYLCNKVVPLQFNKRYVDMNFVTDNCYSGRGFRAMYEQQLCDNTTTTTTESGPTVPPDTTTERPIPTTTELLPEACGGLITHEKFNLEVYGRQESTCRFLVDKLNDSVCTLHINFTDFNLNCDEEYLLVDNKMYCGSLSGENVYINFEKKEIEFLYKRNVPLGLDRRFSIQLVQDYVNCSPDLEPPPDEN